MPVDVVIKIIFAREYFCRCVIHKFKQPQNVVESLSLYSPTGAFDEEVYDTARIIGTIFPEAKEKAEAKGEKWNDGRPKKYSEEEIMEAMELLKTYSYKKVVNMTGISKSTLIRYKRNN